MVHLATVKSLNTHLVQSQPLVAVFFGGTSGICEYTLRALANTHADIGRGLRVYIVGRNAGAAETIMSDCRQICPKGQFKFVQAEDLSLLKDVDKVCNRISKMERDEEEAGDTARIDLLVMSQACSIFQPQKDTPEGLDFLMSLMYYSRIRAVMNLLPLLTASTLPARVVSVYAAGTEAKIFPDDLLLRQPGRYNYFQARSHITCMKRFFMQSLAKKYEGKLSLIHIFPGLVMTPAFQNPDIPSWFRVLWRLIGGLMTRFYAVPAEECGARVLSLASSKYPARGTMQKNEAKEMVMISTDAVPGGGAYSINWNGEVISPNKAVQRMDKAQMESVVWEHTMKAFGEIEKGRVLTG